MHNKSKVKQLMEKFNKSVFYQVIFVGDKELMVRQEPDNLIGRCSYNIFQTVKDSKREGTDDKPLIFRSSIKPYGKK